jgi:transcriptional regulator with XRE-family HTH domain
MSAARFKKPWSRNFSRRLDSIWQHRFKAGSLSLGMPGEFTLRFLRQSLGLTLKDAAARVGCSRSELTRLERSEHESTIRLSSLAKVLAAYECRLVWLPVPSRDANFEELRDRVATRVSSPLKCRFMSGFEVCAKSGKVVEACGSVDEVSGAVDEASELPGQAANLVDQATFGTGSLS